MNKPNIPRLALALAPIAVMLLAIAQASAQCTEFISGRFATANPSCGGLAAHSTSLKAGSVPPIRVIRGSSEDFQTFRVTSLPFVSFGLKKFPRFIVKRGQNIDPNS
jgi:hypothetical protein